MLAILDGNGGASAKYIVLSLELLTGTCLWNVLEISYHIHLHMITTIMIAISLLCFEQCLD